MACEMCERLWNQALEDADTLMNEYGWDGPPDRFVALGLFRDKCSFETFNRCIGPLIAAAGGPTPVKPRKRIGGGWPATDDDEFNAWLREGGGGYEAWVDRKATAAEEAEDKEGDDD